MSRAIYSTKAWASVLGTYLLTSNAYALPRCGVEDQYANGVRALRVHVPGLTPSDVLNNASGAWTKIAQKAQQLYGGNVYIGQTTLILSGSVYGVNAAIPGTFPFHFSGGISVQKEILNNFASGSPADPDPAPCDPDKNACCDDCGAAYASLDGINIFKKGYVPHFAEMQLQNLSRRNGVVHGRPQHLEIDWTA